MQKKDDEKIIKKFSLIKEKQDIESKEKIVEKPKIISIDKITKKPEEKIIDKKVEKPKEKRGRPKKVNLDVSSRKDIPENNLPESTSGTW